ncbi:MAG: glycosyltransferase family 2 protein, partial [Candidatus Methanomethylicia archaeon]|nr:glycosyltransferase family 2 protein [Candidatus Methanomethylicia archaeon]
MSKVSIIVTSYTIDRLFDIYRLLDSIAAQTCRDLQVIFVADHCEELYTKVKDRAQVLPVETRVLLHNSGERGVNICRNIGIQASDGDILGFIDDDAVLFPDWVEQTIRIYTENSEVAGLTGPAFPLWDEPEVMSWFPKELYFVWGCTVWDWDEDRPIRNVGGMNCSFRRHALESAGLFRPGLGPVGGEERIPWFHPSGEEIDLSLRVRKALGPSGLIIYSPRVRILHRVQGSRFNTAFVIKRCFRFGYTRHFIRRYYVDQKARSDENILQLEYDHLKSIGRSIIKSLRGTVHQPIQTARILLTLSIGVTAVAVG